MAHTAHSTHSPWPPWSSIVLRVKILLAFGGSSRSPDCHVDLRLILHNTEHAARDARAAMDATQRFIAAFGPRLSALEARFGALEIRTSGIERTLDEIARSGHRMEPMLTDLLAWA